MSPSVGHRRNAAPPRPSIACCKPFFPPGETLFLVSVGTHRLHIITWLHTTSATFHSLGGAVVTNTKRVSTVSARTHPTISELDQGRHQEDFRDATTGRKDYANGCWGKPPLACLRGHAPTQLAGPCRVRPMADALPARCTHHLRDRRTDRPDHHGLLTRPDAVAVVGIAPATDDLDELLAHRIRHLTPTTFVPPHLEGKTPYGAAVPTPCSTSSATRSSPTCRPATRSTRPTAGSAAFTHLPITIYSRI